MNDLIKYYTACKEILDYYKNELAKINQRIKEETEDLEELWLDKLTTEAKIKTYEKVQSGIVEKMEEDLGFIDLRDQVLQNIAKKEEEKTRVI